MRRISTRSGSWWRWRLTGCCVGDTDNGKALKERIGELQELLNAYRSGRIIERT